MGANARLIPSDSASDSDDPLDVIERGSPPRSASRPTPQRNAGSARPVPTPTSTKRGSSSNAARYSRTRDESDDSMDSSRDIHSRFAVPVSPRSTTKRRRIVSDSESGEEGSALEAKKHGNSLGRFVADGDQDGATSHRTENASEPLVQKRSTINPEPPDQKPTIPSRRPGRRVMSGSDDERQAVVASPGCNDDAFGIIASIKGDSKSHSSSPASGQISPALLETGESEADDVPGLRSADAVISQHARPDVDEAHMTVDPEEQQGEAKQAAESGPRIDDVSLPIHSEIVGEGYQPEGTEGTEHETAAMIAASVPRLKVVEGGTNKKPKTDSTLKPDLSLRTGVEQATSPNDLDGDGRHSVDDAERVEPEKTIEHPASNRGRSSSPPAAVSADKAMSPFPSQTASSSGQHELVPSVPVDGRAESSGSPSFSTAQPTRPILPQTPADLPTTSESIVPYPVIDPATTSAHGGYQQPQPVESNLKESPSASEGKVDQKEVAVSELEEEGEDEIDLDEVEDIGEDAGRVGESAESEKGSRKEEIVADQPAAAESEPAVVLNSKGKPKQKPGPKAGWKLLLGTAEDGSKKGAKPKSGTEEKKAGKGSSTAKKGKVEALKSAARGRSGSISESQAAAAETPSDQASAAGEMEDEAEDETIYCSCGKESRSDGNDTLIGCDGCDHWFHAGCVGLTEEQVGLVDTFFCSDCEKTMGQRSTMKRLCKRDGCEKQYSNQASKFCSSVCAFHHAQATLAAMQNKKQLKQLASALAKYPSPPPDIRIVEHYSVNTTTAVSAIASSSDLALDLEKRVSATRASISVLEKRLVILAQAIEQCDALRPINTAAGADESGKSKKRKTGGGEDRPCGWVECLIWSDEAVAAWEAGMPLSVKGPNGAVPTDAVGGGDVEMQEAEEAGVGYCMMPRKRCDRHSGWQKTINYSLDFEMSQLQDTLTGLQTERERFLEQKANLKAGRIARDNLHELLALRLAKQVF